MEIVLTKEQYFDLLKLVYIGNWMVNANRIGGEGDELIEAFDDMESYILSYTNAFGLGELADYDEIDHQYYPTRILDDDPEIRKYIDEYDNETFWDKLVERLSLRDLMAQYGDRLFKLGWQKHMELLEPIERAYANEFSKHGIDNLFLRIEPGN